MSDRQLPQKDFLIVLDQKDIIQSIMPDGIEDQKYVGQSITSMLDEHVYKSYEMFKKNIIKSHVILNAEMTLKNNRHCYFSGYNDENTNMIIVIFENLSDQEVFRKILKLNNSQLNAIRELNQSIKVKDDLNYEQISKLNSELLNSRRIIEKQNAELLKYNKLLKQMSIEDSLTGCYNRRHFYDYMRETVLSSQVEDMRCLIMIDFNHFKTINDQFGHDAGDRLLINFVKVTKDILSAKGEIFRLGGDEFILLTNHQDADQAHIMMQKINQQFYNFSKISSLAYGIILFKMSEVNHIFELTNLIKKADDLMYQHKRSQNESNQ